MVQNIWAPLGKHFAPPGVPSWLRAWCYVGEAFLTKFFGETIET